ncbi:MAG: hypothetical protein PHC39_04505 [Proteiniphilum sp.]|nr:hypothetical protein [Proteiniphilum sp.]
MKPIIKLFGIVLLLCLVSIASAVPTTNAATLVGSNNATVSATGAAGTYGWFIWGQNIGNEYWITPNITISTGAFSYTLRQSPLFGNTRFYYKACDQTGCGNEQSFTTIPVTPIPQQAIGTFYTNITESGMDIPNMAIHLADAYMWTSTPITLVFMLIFSPVFIGVWLRSRTVLVALILGFIAGSFILYSNAVLGVSMPGEVADLARAICYIAFAGVIVYIIKR